MVLFIWAIVFLNNSKQSIASTATYQQIKGYSMISPCYKNLNTSNQEGNFVSPLLDIGTDHHICACVIGVFR